MGKPSGLPQTVRTASRTGYVLLGIGLCIVLIDIVVDGDTSTATRLIFGVYAGYWLGRVGEYKARLKGKGLRDGQ